MHIRNTDRQILRLAIPSVISNITVPLLSLTDSAIAGHLGSEVFIGAAAVGTMLINMLLWLFAFLRMGTGGMVAQAYGRGDMAESRLILMRALWLSALIGMSLIALSMIGTEQALHLVGADASVSVHAAKYFRICIWGAPAALALYSFSGWFVGMQNTRVPMYVAIFQNVLNVILSLFFVIVLHMQLAGAALGTIIAQYAGVAIMIVFWRKLSPGSISLSAFRSCIKQGEAMSRFFKVNRDIFLRTLCLIITTTSFTTISARMGNTTLAVNTLLMQFFMLFSYFIDGFAFAAEALGGRYFGAGMRHRFNATVHRLFFWGIAFAIIMSLAYVIGAKWILRILTNDAVVISAAHEYLPWIWILPGISFAAFLYDGLYIGTTSTRLLLISMFAAMLIFLAGSFFLMPMWANHGLWAAYLIYLGTRGAMQHALFGLIERRMQ